jgi:DNA-directed RNA polymerase specialized sigma24 family protein
MPAVDHFPSTHGTWLSTHIDTIVRAELEDGRTTAGSARADVAQARRALRDHLMHRYAQALTAYVSASHFRQLGEPDDLVGGFFVRVLSDDDFMLRWRQSGLPLRRWLMNAMRFHCRGIARDVARERGRTHGGRTHADPVGGGLGLEQLTEESRHEASRAFDRAWALTLVNDAYARVQQMLREEGLVQDDAVLRMHVMESMTYEQVAGALGLSRQDCFNAMRRIAARVRAALSDLLLDEGVPKSAVDTAIADVMRLIESRR